MIKSEEKRSNVVANLENTANHCGSTHTHTGILNNEKKIRLEQVSNTIYGTQFQNSIIS